MIEVCRLDALPPGESARVVSEVPIVVFNVDGELYALDDTCSHQDASLSDGWLEGYCVECPLHSSQFDVRTGQPTCPPAKKPLNTYDVEVLDGTVYVAASPRIAHRAVP